MAAKKTTKAPKARPGDTIYDAANGKLPLPPVERFNPPAEVAIELTEAAEALDELVDGGAAEDDTARQKATLRYLRASYRTLKAGLPSEYRARVAEIVTMAEAADIMASYSDADGVTAGK